MSGYVNAPNLSQKRKQNPSEREEVPIHFDPLVDADGTEIRKNLWS